jgi:short-subunit dehydrogenase
LLTAQVLPNVHYFDCDLANQSQIHSVAAKITSTIGDPTIVVSNAGFARGNTILSAKATDIDLTFKINSISHYHLAQAFLPAMVKNNHGLWLTVASNAGYVTAPGLIDYSASKASAIVFHEGLSTELVTNYNAPAVRTVLMCQGYTKTALFTGFHPGDNFYNYALEPETVAQAIVDAVLAGRSTHIILPVGHSIVAAVRNWPGWMQALGRRDLKKMMINWNGRQVSQPSETVDSRDASPATSKSVESSTVLVDS